MSAQCAQGHATAALDFCDTCGVPLAAQSMASAATEAMAPVRCSQGHSTAATDYCDTCGEPVGASPVPQQQPSLVVSTLVCEHCQAGNPAEALFCEGCGYDFTTGALPPSAGHPALPGAPAAAGSLALGADAAPQGAVAAEAGWVVEMWVDPAWYAEQDSEHPCPSPGLPRELALTGPSAQIGRASASRTSHPDIDCVADVGVSRRHAQLTTDGSLWWVEDLGSSNGTFIASATGPMPTEPIAPGQPRELREDERIYLGAWTRLVLRPAVVG